MDEEVEYKKTNREKVQTPKLGIFYCTCDRALVGKGRKCKFCGTRDPGKTFKK